jgi:hypothetical protein
MITITKTYRLLPGEVVIDPATGNMVAGNRSVVTPGKYKSLIVYQPGDTLPTPPVA